MNANARYKAFARKAEVERLPGAASLFRAAARAEQIHANNHARVIRHLGGEAKAPIHPVHVQSTLKNLKAALSGVLREIDSLYPAFLNEAIFKPRHYGCPNTTLGHGVREVTRAILRRCSNTYGKSRLQRVDAHRYRILCVYALRIHSGDC